MATASLLRAVVEGASADVAIKCRVILQRIWIMRPYFPTLTQETRAKSVMVVVVAMVAVAIAVGMAAAALVLMPVLVLAAAAVR